ncbi:SMC5 Structural maintenance of chromosomes protein 5 [Candida maltosa Xu316]|uniref:Structural maintenance of chromosomes protein 5 n=1 Tax=Candida maltosa (strain Xu316) TaxID=1245528 RepID=M3K034_CANMX|nr:Structural maintenance of chromosomes protein, putative [Candida maltosa Xu316]
MNGSATKKRKVAEPAVFKPGFIRNVKVWNFTTYSYTEFSLSPTLNMIIGPNGSGKSTLVASICIGLAGNINLIKRKNLKSMIKTGHDKAAVEITLENNDGKPPIVIKREFTAKDSTWTINHKRATESKVREIRAKFNIQLDNLCHFLPQERVAEFAGLSPEKLLMETERTLGDGHLLEMHNDLIDKDNTVQELANKIKEIQNRLAKLHEERSRLEEEAKKLEEYERKKQAVDNHRLLIPFAKYSDMKKQSTHLKRLRNEAKEKLKTFQANFEPLKNDISKAGLKFDAETREYESIKKSIRSYDNTLTELKASQKNITSEISELLASVKSYRTKAEQKKTELEEARREVENLTQKLEGLVAPDPEQLQQLTAEYSTKRNEVHGLEDKIREENSSRSDLNTALRRISDKIKDAEHRLQSKEKLDVLIGDARQTGRNYRLRDESFKVHKNLRSRPDFEGKYFEAPIISCNVSDTSYAAAVEKIIDNNTLFALTVNSQHNFESLTRYFERTESNTPIRMVNSSSTPAPSLSEQELKSYGFDGYLSSFLTGPREVLTMLYNTSKLHTIPVSKRPLSDEDIKRLTSASGSGKILFMKFVAGDTLYTIQKSRYGSQQSFYITEKVGRSQYFAVQGMSQEAKDAVSQEIATLQEELQSKKEVYENHRSQIDAYSRQTEELKNQMTQIRRQQADYQNSAKIIEQTKAKIASRNEKIVRLEKDSNKDYSQRVRSCEQKIEEKYIEFAKISCSISDILLQIAQKENESKLKKFDIIYWSNRKKSADALIRELNGKQEKLKEDYTNYKKKYDEIKESDAYLEMERINENYSNEERQKLSGLAEEYINNDNFSEATILSKISLLEDELSLLTTADTGSIDALKQKLSEIQIAETNLPIFESEKARLEKRISGIQESYEGELSSLVNKISLAFNKRFSKVASDGRVELAKSERFKDWKLQILVKFRQESELKILDHQSQSGGERAVSTIFFIMSLQGLTDAPFRIVDEINQGMDPKNEQMAHRYLVHTACQNNNSQYFLVTPKLLTGLYYHPDMVVHCIFTGPYITDNKEKRDTSKGMLDFAVV